MIVVRIQTNDMFRVIRKYENKRARLMLINSLGNPAKFNITYCLDEPNE